MSPRKDSTSEEMADNRDNRVAGQHLSQHERYLALLRQAKHQQLKHDGQESLDEAIKYGEAELRSLQVAAGSRIISRRRPKKTATALSDTCTVYIDECGQHSLTSKDDFGAFVLAGVIIPDAKYSYLDNRWREWKSSTLGSADRFVHEPDVRKGRGSFWFDDNEVRRSEARKSLNELLTELEFTAVVCVINRSDYVSEFGSLPLDNSLPTNAYLMSVDFLMERLVMILESQYGSARAQIVAEARGPLEDALFQREYARLLIDGTSYV